MAARVPPPTRSCGRLRSHRHPFDPLSAFLFPGQRHDSIGVDPLIFGVDFDALIADKAFDNDALRATLKDRGAAAVIPAKAGFE